MIKKKPLPVPTVQVPETLAGFIQGPDYTLNTYIASHKHNITRDTNSIQEYTERIERLHGDIALKVKAVKSEQKNLAIKEAQLDAIDMTAFNESMTLQLAKVARNPFIESLQVNDGNLVVETKPLFTLVRVADGSKKHIRRCIGAFKITIEGHGSDRIYATNLLWTTYGYPHWSVNSEHKICQGEWAPVFQAMREGNDVSGLINSLLDYFRSTLDSGAYVRSHNWIVSSREEWRESKVGAATYAVGDAVIVLSTNSHNRGTRGIVSELTTSEGKQHIRIKDMRNVHGAELAASSYWEKSERFMPISKLFYRRLEITTESIAELTKKYEAKRAGSSVAIEAAMDNSPDGVSLADLITIKNS